MKTILALVLFLVVGFIGARGWASRTKIKFPLSGFLLTGIEFFFVGVLFGPAVLNVISPEVQEELKPLIYLALGWAGLLFGVQMSWMRIKKVKQAIFKMIAIDASIVAILFLILSYLFVRAAVPGAAPMEIFYSGGILAITASVSSPTLIAVLSAILPSRGSFTNTAKLISSLHALLPIFFMGIFFAFFHPSFLGRLGVSYGILWWIFTNVCAVALGFVMVMLTKPRCSEDERLLLIIGIVMLVGGVCYFLKLSSLYTAMVMGFVVGNFSRRQELIYRQLLQVEKTLFVAFLILVGATVDFGARDLSSLLTFYFMVRMALKLVASSWAFRRCFPEFSRMGMKSGLVFIGQGGIALAMVLDYRLVAGSTLAGTVVTAIALGVVLTEFLGFFLTRMALESSGEVPPRSALAEGGKEPTEERGDKE